jgi:hypothetical protein
MEPLLAPELPTVGRAFDLEGWARAALAVSRLLEGRAGDERHADGRPHDNGLGAPAANGAAGGYGHVFGHHGGLGAAHGGAQSANHGGARSGEVARVLWRTAFAAAQLEREREGAARAWFDDLALGRVVLPGHLLVRARPDAALVLARHDEWHAATVLCEELEDEPSEHGQGRFDPGAPAPTSALRPFEVPRAFGAPRRGDPRLAPLARRLDELAERPRARLLFTRRARWCHPAVRGVAVAVVGPPVVRAWMNVLAFVDASAPRDPARVLQRGATDGLSFDWSALRAATERATRLLDGLLDAHAEDPTWRRIGLGLAGLSDALERLGLVYGSEEACLFARRVANAVAEQAHRTSVQLAEERGVFDRFADTRWARMLRPRRHALCSLSWPSDGLHAACGLSEGVAWHGVEDADEAAPPLEAQVRLQVECQRAFEGVVAAQLVVGSAGFDPRALASALLEMDVQCLALDRVRHSELLPARHDAARGAQADLLGDSLGRASNGSHAASHGPSNGPSAAELAARQAAAQALHHGVANGSGAATHGTDARFALDVAPALRVQASGPRGRWVLDLVLDARGDRERELLLVAAPPGADGWRLVERLNAELARGAGLAAALSHQAADLEAGSAARELAELLTQVATRHGALARVAGPIA